MPNLIPFTPSKPLLFWCQKIIPLVYDDSLSYYELLCKVVKYLNDMAESLNQMGENINTLNQAIEELQNFVNQTLSEQSLEKIIRPIIEQILEEGSFNLPIASENKLGAVKVGDGLNIESDGTLNAEAQEYTLPIATAERLGGVKKGANITINENGVIDVPLAQYGSYGVIKGEGGRGIGIQNGIITVNLAVKNPYANYAGIVLPGDTISLNNADGKIDILPPTTTRIGGVKAGTGISIAEDGTISATGEATATDVEWSEIKNKPVATAGGVVGLVNLGAISDGGQFTTGTVGAKTDALMLSDNVTNQINKIATSTETGRVKPGTNLTVTSDGTLNANIPQATTTVLGGIKFFPGFFDTANGQTFVAYANKAKEAEGMAWSGLTNVPTASTTVKGIMQVGNGLAVSNGIVQTDNGTLKGSLSGTTLTITIK